MLANEGHMDMQSINFQPIAQPHHVVEMLLRGTSCLGLLSTAQPCHVVEMLLQGEG